MKKLGILLTFIFCIGMTSSYALTYEQAEAFELFGISTEQVERLQQDPRLNLNFKEDAELFSRFLTAIQVARMANLDIAMNDEAHMPSYLKSGKTMANTGEAAAARQIVEAEIVCRLDLIAATASDVAGNYGMAPESGYGFVEFHRANQDLYRLQSVLQDENGGAAVEQRLDEILFDAAQAYTASGVATFNSCGGDAGYTLDENKCCANGDDGVSQQCDDSNDKKCGIFRRNGTVVCRITSDSC